MEAISIKNLTVKYKDLVAVNCISFSVEKGEIFGIIGPNGAGKTSTIECIEGLRKHQDGEITILGGSTSNRASLYHKVGVQLQETRLHDKLKVIEIIKLFQSFYENPADYNELLEIFDLQGHVNHFARKLSGGQQQRLAIILALMGNPEIVILDEISTGLDPAGRIQIWDLIKKLRDSGKTILMTTQYMEEAEYLCDRVCMIVKGKIRAIGTLNDLIEKADMPIRILLTKEKGKTIELTVRNPEEIYPAIKNAALNDEVLDIKITKPNLQDIFLKLTGESLGEMQ